MIINKKSLSLTLAAIVSGQAGAVNDAVSYELEEVVITAQKRAQSAQDMGIAVSAFSGEQLKTLGVTDLSELPNSIPNVNLYDAYGAAQPVWIIRGVGLQDYNANNTPAAAVYVDEIYQTSTAMGAMGLYDLERIEVLKGPQGGLYGRNTTGGAVLVNTAKPNFEGVSGYLNASYGKWDQRNIEGAINVPLSDTAAFRLSGQRSISDDKYSHSLSDNKDHGEDDSWSMRAQLRVAPTDNLDVLLKFRSAEDRSEFALARSIGHYTSGAGGIDPVLQGALGLPASIPGLNSDFVNNLGWGGANGLCPSFVAGNANGASCYTVSGKTTAGQGGDVHDTYGDAYNAVDNRLRGGSVVVNWDISDNTVLTYVGGYDDFNYVAAYDWDADAGAFTHFEFDNVIKAWSHELRANIDLGDTQVTVGAMVAEDSYHETRDLIVSDNAIYAAPPPNGFGAVARLDFIQTTESQAIFTQVEHALSEQWKLIGSLRYTDEEKEYDGSSPYLSEVYGLPDSAQKNFWDFTNTSAKLAFEWTPDEDTLIYLSYSEGFKAGGFFGGFGTSELALKPYDEETVASIELGFKADLLDRTVRLNGAIFHYDYRDLQGNSLRKLPNGSTPTLLTNIGDAEYLGAEMELTWAVSERLIIQAGIGYVDAEITDSDMVSIDTGTGDEYSYEGLEIINTPDWTGNLAITYTQPLLDGYSARFSANANYSGEKLFYYSPSVPAKAIHHEDAYTLVGGRISLSPAEENWELALWGKNLTDKEYRITANHDGLASWTETYGAPMSWGIDFNYQF